MIKLSSLQLSLEMIHSSISSAIFFFLPTFTPIDGQTYWKAEFLVSLSSSPTTLFPGVQVPIMFSTNSSNLKGQNFSEVKGYGPK